VRSPFGGGDHLVDRLLGFLSYHWTVVVNRNSCVAKTHDGFQFQRPRPARVEPHHPSSSLTCIAMLRSSSVGTARIGTTVPPRSTDPRLFQARATRPRPRSACATDDSEAARTRRAAAGTGTVVLFVVGRSPDSLDWNSPRRWCRTCSGMASFSPCWFPSACWDGCHSPSVLTGRHFTEGIGYRVPLHYRV